MLRRRDTQSGSLCVKNMGQWFLVPYYLHRAEPEHDTRNGHLSLVCSDKFRLSEIQQILCSFWKTITNRISNLRTGITTELNCFWSRSRHSPSIFQEAQGHFEVSQGVKDAILCFCMITTRTRKLEEPRSGNTIDDVDIILEMNPVVCNVENTRSGLKWFATNSAN